MARPVYVMLEEDETALGLRPFTWTRPAFELRTGVFSLRERAEIVAPGRVRARVRAELEPLLRFSHPELLEKIPGDAECIPLDGRAHLTVTELEQYLKKPTENPPELLENPWQLVQTNGRDLCEDFRVLQNGRGLARSIFGVRFEKGTAALECLADSEFGDATHAIVYPGVHILEEKNVLFGAGARVKPGVVLDAEEGPIVLGAGCRIESNVTIQGPAYVGPGTVVHPMTRLRHGSSLGALCKVGGEIEEAVLLDLSNKQHDGFLGHAYLGSWVNLGADTNASDLKNNYGTVRVNLGQGAVDTEERFVGPMLGDHVRTGINTMLNTGTVAGVCCNVFGAEFPPTFLASFSWGGASGRVEYQLEKAIETARVVHGRRGVEFSELHEALLRQIHRATEGER